jgi:transglutaminase-like putative cysteine protease
MFKLLKVATAYLLWLLPLSWLWLWWQQSINFVFFILFYTFSFALSSLVPSGWPLKKLLLLLLGYCALLVASQFVLIFVDQLFLGNFPVALIKFNLNFIPLVLILLPYSLLNYMVGRLPKLAKYQFLVRFLLVIASFWANSNYKIMFYQHPVTLLVLLSLYVVLESLNFILLNYDYTANKGQLKKISFSLIATLPLLLLVPLIFKGATKGGMSANYGGLLEPSLSGNFDFSPTLNLQGKIEQSDELLVMLRTEEPLQQKTLIRRFTLSGYSDKEGFYRIDSLDSPFTMPNTTLNIVQPYSTKRHNFRQEYYLLNIKADALLALNSPQSIIPYQNWPQSSFKGVFSVNSAISQASADNLEQVVTYGQHLSKEERLATIKGTNNARLSELARQITATLNGPYAKALAINDYLKNNYYYSLDVGSTSSNLNNLLNYFLFEGKRGYCSYFALSMTLMLRSLNIPSRLVTGFFTLPQDETMGLYPITAAKAHAWVEIYIDDYGWIEFDPTSDRRYGFAINLGGFQKQSDYYPFINEIVQNYANLQPVIGKVQQLNLTNTAGQRQGILALIPNNKGLLMVLVIVFAVLLYRIIVVYLLARLSPQLSDSPVVQVNKQMFLLKRYYFLWCTTKKSLYYFLKDEYPQLLFLYRKANYSRQFSSEEGLKFIELSKIMGNNIKKKCPYYRRLLALFNPYGLVKGGY